MRFHGNEICCSSYACLNAMRNEEIDLQLFEISTSTPFGIRHYENNHFDRLLTTYHNPNQGLDDALELWGYKCLKYTVSSIKSMTEIIKKYVKNYRIVLGPIDMGGLAYQAMSHILNRMDHYLMLEYWSEDSVSCYDSEGFSGYQLSYKELESYVSVYEVPEAENVITIRVIIQKGSWSIKDILQECYIKAYRNLSNAELEGHGSRAICRCYDFLIGNECYKWRLSFLYDLEYLIQRKWLGSVLNDEYKKYSLEQNNALVDDIENNIQAQLNVLGKMYNELRTNSQIVKEHFEVLSDLEINLSQNILKFLTHSKLSMFMDKNYVNICLTV